MVCARLSAMSAYSGPPSARRRVPCSTYQSLPPPEEWNGHWSSMRTGMPCSVTPSKVFCVSMRIQLGEGCSPKADRQPAQLRRCHCNYAALARCGESAHELQEADTGTAPGAGTALLPCPGKSYNKQRGDAQAERGAYVSCSPTQRFFTKKQDRPPKANRPDLPSSA